MSFRNRIIETKEMRIGDILDNPVNPYQLDTEQQEELTAIMGKFGIVSPVIAYYSERNGGSLTLFNGHQRKANNPDQTWQVTVIDLDDDEIDELVLYFDESTARGRRDEAILAKLMMSAESGNDALERLLSDVAQSANLARLAEQTLEDGLVDQLAEVSQQSGAGEVDAVGGSDGMEYTAGVDEEDDGLGGFDPSSVVISDIRQVQLLFSGEQRDEFAEMCAALADRFGTANTTDTVMKAVRFCYENVDPA